MYLLFQIVDFMNAHYRPNRMAVVATGIEHDELTQLAGQMTFSTRDVKPNDKKATYLGGLYIILMEFSLFLRFGIEFKF